MAIYEYHCEECGSFEIEQRITEHPIKDCPTCGREVRRQIGAGTNFVLRGRRWARDGYGDL